MLIKNPSFAEKIDIGDANAYIFDSEIYSNDWFNFIMGKYSKLSTVLKKAIKVYYGSGSTEYEYMQNFKMGQDFHRSHFDHLLDMKDYKHYITHRSIDNKLSKLKLYFRFEI